MNSRESALDCLAVIRMALASTVPDVHGAAFWGTLDKYSWLNGASVNKWPFTPPVTDTNPNDPKSSNPDILGLKYDVTLEPPAWTGAYWQKPAYGYVREAIENYFGTAFSVKDPAGAELVRFVANGNVIVLKGDIHQGVPSEEVPSWEGIGASNSFIVRKANGDPVAVVEADGEVYLAGIVEDGIEDLAAPENKKALIVKDTDGNVLSLIDDTGKLQARGEVIVKGVPYTLETTHSSDIYNPET